MKINDIKTYLYHNRISNRNWLYVKTCTDNGVEGIGEAYSVGPDEATVATIHDFKTWLLGEDPLNIEYLWQKMYNFSRFPGGSVVNSAISGIEHSLWDIVGKVYGAPIYRLLGGKSRDKIRTYQSSHGDTPEELAENSTELIKKYGYTSLKIAPHSKNYSLMSENAIIDEAADRLKAVREAVGEDVDIGVDAHARIFEPIRAIMMAHALEPYKPFFLEEPLRPENIDAMATVTNRSPIPIATGEQLYTKWQFRELLEKRAADIIQPDVCCVGGILEFRKIAAMAEAHYISVAPHNPMSPLATAINIHLSAVMSNFLVLEQHPSDDPPWNEILKDPIQIVDGHYKIPTKPGIGVELNERVFEEQEYEHWHRKFVYNKDGSVALI
jgi:galactonate dehydratase